LRGSFSMNNDVDFQIVCVDCGCLAVRIEDPLKASRQAIVYCGDCGVSRGTVGALRDLAVQPNPAVEFSTRSVASCKGGRTVDESQSCSEISRRYRELRRLRRQVEIAESLAAGSDGRLPAIGHTVGENATLVPLRCSRREKSR
jgi:hypothetical protein